MATHRVNDPLTQPLPRHAISRPELERHLDLVEPGGLGLVVASAGSGKSILLRQWAASRADVRIVGLGLDAGHDDAAVLARDLVAALRTGAPDLDASIVDLAGSGGSTMGSTLRGRPARRARKHPR